MLNKRMTTAICLSTLGIAISAAPSFANEKEGIITAKLIDECGLKGFSIGDAEVSTKHAWFFINKGKATAKDFLKLVEHVKKEVKSKFDVDIELEILVIGEEK